VPVSIVFANSNQLLTALVNLKISTSASEMESHIVRFIMAEKNIEREVANLKTEEIPEKRHNNTAKQASTIVISLLLKKGWCANKGTNSIRQKRTSKEKLPI
jgi:hypothetical protein